MRFSVQLLGTSATVNSFKAVSLVEINQGETIDLYVQLVDKDQSSLRYMPAAGATLFVEIPRFPDFSPTSMNVREEKDFSVRRFASQPFSADGSIWKIALTALETSTMMSSNIRFTLTETSVKRIVVIPQALKVVRSEEV